jgi:hypothetical protein
VFFWLALKDRLSTRALLKRKNMALESYNCVLCHLDVEESLHHLFFHCPFAMSCWNLLDLAHLIQDDILDSILLFKMQIQSPIFMEIIIAMFWAIWSAQNDLIFRQIQHPLASRKIIFKHELAQVKLRAKEDFKPLIDSWLVHFV